MLRSRFVWKKAGSSLRLTLLLLCILFVGVVGFSSSWAATPVAPAGRLAVELPQLTLTPEDDSSPYGRGYVPAPFELNRTWGEPHLAPQSAPLPDRFDWRTQGKVTRVQNQGPCGSCYAFACLGSLESQLLIRNQPRYDFSENNIVECHWEARAQGRNGCDGGNVWLVTNHLSAFGTVEESCDPYNPANESCRTGCPYIKTVTEMWALYGANPPVESLKTWLRDYGPLYVAINAGQTVPGGQCADWWCQAFQTYDGSYTLYNPDNDPYKLNHAVLLVGWDDNLQHQGGRGAWIVKNSWGTNWGGTCGYGSEKGYFTIAYGSAGIGSMPAVFRDWKDYSASDTLLYLDDAGVNNWYGWRDSTTAYGLVVLTPGANGCATQVEFWTSDATDDVDIYIYDSFNGSQPSVLLWKRENLSFDFAGYHHVAIQPPLQLTAGNDVAVMIQFSNAEYQYPVPVDLKGPIAPGRSFASGTGAAGSWVDLGAQSQPADVGIRLRMAPCGARETSTPTQRPATATPTKTTTRPVTLTPTRTRTPGSSPTLGRNRAYLPLLLRPGAVSQPTATPTLRATSTSTPRAPTITPTSASDWVIIKEENFEGDFPNNWTITGADYTWGKRNCRAAGGSYSGWAVGGGSRGQSLTCGSNYPDNAGTGLVYGPFSLADARAAEVLFDYWFNSEEDYDLLYITASIDGREFYGLERSGDSGGWRSERFDLTNVYVLGNLAGQPQVWIGFSFGTDGDTNEPEGAYVDNIVLRKAATGSASGAGAELEGTSLRLHEGRISLRER